ncbi:MAG: PorP/SprF family type IX secretion system membrane protein [Saprospiraceae bacterium]
MKRNIAFIILFITIHSSCYSQQNPNWSSFYENGFIWNPALTAKHNSWELSLTQHQQWAGFDDAPRYSTVAFQMPFINRRGHNRASIGVFLESDKVGPYSILGAAITYSYKFELNLLGNKNDALSIGVLAKGQSQKYDVTTLTSFDGTASGFDVQDSPHKLAPKIGIGMFYISKSDVYNTYENYFYFGISAGQFINNNFSFNNNDALESNTSASANFGFRRYLAKSDYFIEPGVLLVYSKDNSVNTMVNVKIEHQLKYWVAMGAVTNGEVFMQTGLILDEDSFLSSMLNSGKIRLGVKASYQLSSSSRLGPLGYEFYLAYVYELDK